MTISTKRSYKPKAITQAEIDEKIDARIEHLLDTRARHIGKGVPLTIADHFGGLVDQVDDSARIAYVSSTASRSCLYSEVALHLLAAEESYDDLIRKISKFNPKESAA